MFVAPGDSNTALFGAGSSVVGLLQQDLFGKSVSYQRGAYPLGSIEVMDIDTGAYRSYFTFDFSMNGGRQCTQTALNDKYVFWNYDPEGFFAANRQTGEVRRLTSGLAECKRFCATSSGLVCTDGAVRFVGPRASLFHPRLCKQTVPAPYRAIG